MAHMRIEMSVVVAVLLCVPPPLSRADTWGPIRQDRVLLGECNIY